MGSTEGGGGEGVRLLTMVTGVTSSPLSGVVVAWAFFLAAAALRFWFFLADFDIGTASDVEIRV